MTDFGIKIPPRPNAITKVQVVPLFSHLTDVTDGQTTAIGDNPAFPSRYVWV